MSNFERDMQKELRFHIEQATAEYIVKGMSPQEARERAARDFGSLELAKDELRDTRRLQWFYDFGQDLRYALRGMRQKPGFAATAVLSLALGIGANAAIFSLWNGVIHANLPVVGHPEDLVMLTQPGSGSWHGNLEGEQPYLSYLDFLQLQQQADSFSELMAAQSPLNTWRESESHGSSGEAQGRFVSNNFFQFLQVAPMLGRAFTAEDDRPDAVPTAVLSYGYWQRRFAGDPGVLGQTITLSKLPLTIIGVAPRGFIGETSGQQPDVWVPVQMQPRMSSENMLRNDPPSKWLWLHVFGRLKPGVTMAQASAQANVLFKTGLESFYGNITSEDERREFFNQRLAVQSGSAGASQARGNFASSLNVLLAAVGMLFLIACVNLANLMLARGTARKPEIALRLSLGASRGRLMRQLCTESFMLAAIGGITGLVLAYAMHGTLAAMMAQSDRNFRMDFALQPVLILFVMGATLVASILFGALPAWNITSEDSGASLKEQTRTASDPAGRARMGRLLVSLQLALALPLLVGAGLLTRTLLNLQHRDLGYSPHGLLQVQINPRDAGYDSARRAAFVADLISQFERIPGVESAAVSHNGLFTGSRSGFTIQVEGYTPTGPDDRGSSADEVGPRYFSTIGIPILLGREILEVDRPGTKRVCVVNEAFAKQFFFGRNPLGMHIIAKIGDAVVVHEIVGVAKDAHMNDLRDDISPRYFMADAQPLSASVNVRADLLIRTAADPGTTLGAIRQTINRADPSVQILQARSIDEELQPLVAQERTVAQLAIVFGLVALTLAAIGLYGVLSYGIARRHNEIAIRIALGAESGRVIGMIVRETAGLVAAGLLLGTGLAYGASRLITSELFGVAPQDPATLAAAIGLLLLVALSTTFLPARRATTVDPVTALRCD